MPEGVQRFEELIAWQKARELTREAQLATAAGKFAKDDGLSNQIQRSCVSLVANIVEGYERKRPAELHQLLSMAQASCAAVRSHLSVAHDIGCLREPAFTAIMRRGEEPARVVGGLRASVERQRSSGLRIQDSGL